MEPYQSRSPAAQYGSCAPTSVSALTARELEVLDLMARDRSNEEIAAELFIALSTVKTHVNHILRKLEQKNRIGAILEYQRCGANGRT
jgi:DNA-binding NarL/FixJ family response regulator